MKEVILIGQKLLEKTMSHSVLSITPKIPVTQRSGTIFYLLFPLHFLSLPPPVCVAGNILWINSSIISFSSLLYDISSIYSWSLSTLRKDSFRSSFSSHTKPPGSPSPATVSVLMLLQKQDLENC